MTKLIIMIGLVALAAGINVGYLIGYKIGHKTGFDKARIEFTRITLERAQQMKARINNIKNIMNREIRK